MSSICYPSSLNQEIVNLLKCGICWEYYNLPTVLPCGHTFCLKCVQEIGKHKVNNVKTTKGGVDLSIDCPNCRLKVPIADIQQMKNGVHVNYVLSSIVEAAIQIKTTPKVDVSTNTDSDASLNYKMDEIQKNLDDFFKAINKRKSVIYDAKNQIDELRANAVNRKAIMEYERRQNAQKSHEMKSTYNPIPYNTESTWASRLFLPEGFQSMKYNTRNNHSHVTDLTAVDPAILSVRTTTSGAANGSFFPVSML